MIISNLNPYAESISGKVELYNGSTLSQTCTCEDVLQDFTIERVGESNKFFGYGICQKAHINLIDIERAIDISTANSFKNYYGVDGEYITPYPSFYVTEVNRDENSNTISVTAYDILYKAKNHTLEELPLGESYTLRDVAEGAANAIGASGLAIEGAEDSFTLFFERGANFTGAEDLRAILNAIAEVTQTIYFINHQEQLVFKRLDVSGEAVETITRDYYYLLDSKTNRRLSAICHATELGDNVTASLEVSGSTQYIRNNPFWELRDDVSELLDNALAVMGGLTINQFSMNWSGNFLLEIGDKIALTLEDESLAHSYLLNDVVRYIGCIDEDTQWSFEDNEGETASNPTSLGDAIKLTYARVDKANKQIELVASETSGLKDEVASLRINTDSINASVSDVERKLTDSLDSINEQITTINTKVDAQMTAEDITLEISRQIENGVDKVETATGFTFNDEGLTITKSDSEIETQITEDGMSVYKNSEPMLTANKDGVKAEDLHATTFLIIGNNSRLEDYGERTACFWIGG